MLTDPSVPPYRPVIPTGLQGRRYMTLTKICVKNTGNVESVKILRSAHADLDRPVVDAIQRWRYRPYMVDGRPVDFCYVLRYEFN